MLDDIKKCKNLNFLIGAGASTPLFPTLSLGKDWPTFEEVVTDPKYTPIKDFMYAYYFEHWLYSMYKTDYDEKDEKSEKEEVKRKYEKFIKVLSKIAESKSEKGSSKINIFTTNYDLLIERAFDKELDNLPLINFNDGSSGLVNKYFNRDNYYIQLSHTGYNDNFDRVIPTINLFKIHGSLSWELEEDGFIKISDKNKKIEILKEKLEDSKKRIKEAYLIDKEIVELFDPKTNQENVKEPFLSAKENRSFTLDDIFKNNIKDLKDNVNGVIPEELTWLKEDVFNEFIMAYKKLPIINPNKDKFNDTVFIDHYYKLIEAMTFELEQEDTVLIVFGFSFADEHLTEIFKRTLYNPKLKVYIICYSDNTKKDLKKKFPGRNNIIYLPDEKHRVNGDFDYLLGELEGI